MRVLSEEELKQLEVPECDCPGEQVLMNPREVRKGEEPHYVYLQPVCPHLLSVLDTMPADLLSMDDMEVIESWGQCLEDEDFEDYRDRPLHRPMAAFTKEACVSLYMYRQENGYQLYHPGDLICQDKIPTDAMVRTVARHRNGPVYETGKRGGTYADHHCDR